MMPHWPLALERGDVEGKYALIGIRRLHWVETGSQQ